jgi:hypothetical protein
MISPAAVGLGAPPVFFFADPDGNGLVYLEEEPGEAGD